MFSYIFPEKESQSEYDGFLSIYAEFHSFSLGIYDGMRTFGLRPDGMRDNPDVDKEPHYYSGGYIFGTIVQALSLVSLSLFVLILSVSIRNIIGK